MQLLNFYRQESESKEAGCLLLSRSFVERVCSNQPSNVYLCTYMVHTVSDFSKIVNMLHLRTHSCVEYVKVPAFYLHVYLMCT